ncbi:MAG: deoxyribonuclease IV [Clostridia bacterium]|nr:deoxyribonuclease IV [Clostridia bacterium]MBQ4250275.1 deoxyribonuclease IV [Clostridia bacterium]
MLKIGCHLSSSKGYYNMYKDAVYVNGTTFQFFTRNPRGGSAKAIDEDDVKKYLEAAGESGIGPVVAHAPYTLNACAADEKKRTFALDTFKDDLARLEYTPGNYYNFHPGSHVGQGVEKGIEYISALLNESLKPDQSTTVLLETMAGKGSEVGSNFSELREIIDRVSLKEKLGVCLDTCHVWDAGYDIVNDLDGVLLEFDRIIGLDRLKAIHLNDSLNPLGAHKDRHARIGEGHLGLEAITRIINHPQFKGLPFCLETPCDIDGYKKEIELLRGLYKG